MPRKLRSYPSVEDRFWSKVNKTDTCWLWTGAKFNGDYGCFWFEGRRQVASRVAWILVNGRIPEGLEPDHVCRVRSCVRPELPHLELVTHRENVLRGESFAAHKARQTSCLRGHAFDMANTRIRPSGLRACRECDRLRCRERRMRVSA